MTDPLVHPPASLPKGFDGARLGLSVATATSEAVYVYDYRAVVAIMEKAHPGRGAELVKREFCDKYLGMASPVLLVCS